MDRIWAKKIKRSIGKIEKKLNSQKFKCLFPSCNSEAINSHSQQRQGQLKSISENGKVYCLNRNSYEEIKRGLHGGEEKNQTILSLKNTGLSEATTFLGFCSTHDQNIFRDIERQQVRDTNSWQALLLFIRSISWEYSQKRRALTRLELFQDYLGKDIPPHALEESKDFATGVDLYLKRDAPYYLDKSFRAYETKNTELLETFWKVIPKNIQISSCCCFNPHLDAYRGHFSPSLDYIQPLATFNVIPGKSGTTVVAISWLKEHHKECSWINKMANENIDLLINGLAFAESEDTCINPSFWESLSIEIKREILHCMRHSTFRGPLTEVPIVISV